MGNYIELQPDFSEAQDELSVCSWLKTTDLGANYWLSYATSTSYNSMVLRVDADQHFRTTGASVRVDLVGVNLVRNVWYHHCFSWKSGEANFYINGVEITYSGSAPTGKMLVGGNLILGQEQDSVGGGFDVNQAFRGEMYNLNIFKKKLSLEEVTAMFVSGRCADLERSLSYEVVSSWEDVLNADIQGEVTQVDSGCSQII